MKIKFIGDYIVENNTRELLDCLSADSESVLREHY